MEIIIKKVTSKKKEWVKLMAQAVELNLSKLKKKKKNENYLAFFKMQNLATSGCCHPRNYSSLIGSLLSFIRNRYIIFLVKISV